MENNEYVPPTLEMPTTEKLQGEDDNNFPISWFMLQKVLGKVFSRMLSENECLFWLHLYPP